MSTAALLSREGEIAIAKRIEAGREAMIAGLCESPLTFQAIVIWRDQIDQGTALLRDIIDLEATNAGPDAPMAPAASSPYGQPLVPLADTLGSALPGSPAHLPLPVEAKPGADGTQSDETAPDQSASDNDADDEMRTLDFPCRHRGRAQAQDARNLQRSRQRLQTPPSPARAGHQQPSARPGPIAGPGAQIQRTQE
jgi:RNA polymerase primary sigma factor